jgi:DNA-binding NarL/FixJ family response regulator
MPVRVALVDDHEVVRRGLRSYFDELDDVDLVGEAGDGVAAMEQVRMLADRQQLPDVVLIDLVMRRMDGLATIRAIKQDHPSVEVLVVTSFSETQRIQSSSPRSRREPRATSSRTPTSTRSTGPSWPPGAARSTSIRS